MDPAHHFIRSLLLHGSTLIGLLGDLAEQLEETGAYPGEEPADVVLEMAAGSVGVHLRRVADGELERAAELMELAVEAVFADLGKAIEIAEMAGAAAAVPEWRRSVDAGRRTVKGDSVSDTDPFSG